MAEIYSARGWEIPPLPWTNLSPPFSHVRALAHTKLFERSRDERKKVEMAFAHLKRIFKLDRLRLRGLSGARDEIFLAATAQNLRKLIRYAGPAPPNTAVGCAA